MKTHSLTILLTRYPTAAFELLCRLNGCDYLHASLGFEEDRNAFYSFGFHGFRKETLRHCVERSSKPYHCVMYELEVSETAYQKAKAVVNWFTQNKGRMRYTRLGAFFAMLRLGLRWQDHYFCSQFVAHVIEKANAAQLKKDSSLYLAEDFARLAGIREVYRGNMFGLAQKYGIAANCAV